MYEHAIMVLSVLDEVQATALDNFNCKWLSKASSCNNPAKSKVIPIFLHHTNVQLVVPWHQPSRPTTRNLSFPTSLATPHWAVRRKCQIHTHPRSTPSSQAAPTASKTPLRLSALPLEVHREAYQQPWRPEQHRAHLQDRPAK
jgi:hypothetical protein